MDTLLKFEKFLETQKLSCLTLYAKNNNEKHLDEYHKYDKLYISNFIKIKNKDFNPKYLQFIEIMIKLKFCEDN